MGLIKNEKKFYTAYSKLSEVKLISIGLASPERIKQWAEKTLPNGKILGEVINANTLHHKTFKPQKGGLFCERIFGPLKDFECACGKPLKYKKNTFIKENTSKLLETNPNSVLLGNIVNKTKNFCNICEVEYTWSVMRRYQLGYIKLISPVTHVWYLKGNPSYLSILLDIKKRHLEYITYCSETLTLENSLKGISAPSKSSDIVSSWNKLKDEMRQEFNQEKNFMATKEKKSNKNSIKNKLEKREKLQLKKLNYSNQFYKRNLIENNSNFNNGNKSFSLGPHTEAWHNQSFSSGGSAHAAEGKSHFNETKSKLYDFFTSSSLKLISFKNIKSDANTKSNNISNKLNIPFSEIKNYATKLNLKKIIAIWLILKKSKYSKEFLSSSNFQNASKIQILKQMSISSYILFKLNQNKKPNFNTISNIAWKKFSSTALKTVLTRLNKIFSRLDSVIFKKNWLNILNSIENSRVKNSELKITQKNITKLLSLIKSSSDSGKMATEKIQKFKKYFLSSLESLLLTNKEFSSFEKSNTPQLSDHSFKNKGDTALNNQILFTSALEFYTLSRFPNEITKMIILNQISYRILNHFKHSFRALFSSLTDTFFKSLIKNSIFSLKSAANTKKSALLVTNVKKNNLQIFANAGVAKINSDLTVSNKLTKDDFDKFKNSLVSFYLIQNSELKEESLKNKNFSWKIPTSLRIFKNTGVKAKNILLKGATNNFETNKTSSMNAKTLFNNIYCLSHRERWETENDWNFLYYFVSSPYLDGQIISNYTNRYKNAYATTLNESNLTYQNISFNLQKSTLFSGPGIVQHLLSEFNFYEIKKMDKQNRILLYQLNKQIFKIKKYAKHERSAKKELKEAYKKRDLLIRRTKLVRKLFIKESIPQSTILSVLPVLPPDLRPIVKMGGQIAASDLNRLYQRVIYRNDRLKKFLKDPATSHSYEMKYAQRLLQEAVDNLIQNGKSGVVSEKDSRGRALKSLSDILKGKQGRFRQYLLGKRVDYSGRSVIVVGPKLKLHECGIPKEMATELYLPFLLKRILNENLSKTVVGAKTLIKTNPSLIWELLREIMQTCPVLLNRAPTLHRLGIQAFQPKLIDGRAILLHPLVCSAFNADFDGDQMAVHVPITVEARAEAWKLMLSRNNILSPATGEPLAIPSQDMVLGCYYLTTNLLNSKRQYVTAQKGSGSYFSTFNNVLKEYYLNNLDLHANIWLKWKGNLENGTDQEEPIEIRVDNFGNWKEIYNKSQTIINLKQSLISKFNLENHISTKYILTTPGKILFNEIIQQTLK
jgi:DNA-directed RNA polymerase beta' subunit